MSTGVCLGMLNQVLEHGILKMKVKNYSFRSSENGTVNICLALPFN